MRINDHKGYSLIELVVVIVIFGIIATVAVRSLQNSVEVTRTVETTAELDLLAAAIVGDPALKSGGTRTDFGYVGDIGALPPSLDALVTNPGLATWNGPYIRDKFSAGGNTTFKQDGWGQTYLYTGGTTITSPAGVTRQLAYSSDDLLNNSVSLSIVDLDLTPPGEEFADSVYATLTYPDGAGGFSTDNGAFSYDGRVSFGGIPIGIHTLKVIFLPENDTLTRKVTVLPGSDYYADLSHFSEVWAATTESGDVVMNGLLAYYKFDESSGLTASDASGQGNPATLTNMAGSEWTTGTIDGSLEFDGGNDLASTADNGSKLQITGDYSTSVWINANSSQKIWAGIYSKTDPSGANNHWNLQFNNAGNRELVTYHGGSRIDWGVYLADVAGAWHHLCVVRNGNSMTLYVDGVVESTRTFASNPVGGNGHLNIAGDRTGTSSYVFEGRIDDLRIYDRVLNNSEIQTLFDQGN